ncbi:MAG TPA: hypothetical protein VJ255_02510, partial [Candidatus Acidoferrum sp.]|nr:hypothetical protein [Candidatus Acidoferrum sp.]
AAGARSKPYTVKDRLFPAFQEVLDSGYCLWALSFLRRRCQVELLTDIPQSSQSHSAQLDLPL